jgi:tetratricopeptide (TPR) repeat protein
MFKEAGEMVRREALLCGIGEYPDLGRLPRVRDEVERLGRILREELHEDFRYRVVIPPEREITTSFLEQKLEAYLQTPVDELLLYLGGHGCIRPGPRYYYVTFGAPHDNPGIRLDDLSGQLIKLADSGKTVIAVLDFCHSGFVADVFKHLGLSVLTLSSLRALGKPLLSEDRVGVLAACAANEFAVAGNDELPSMTSCLIKALVHAGSSDTLRWNDIVQFIWDHMRSNTVARYTDLISTSLRRRTVNQVGRTPIAILPLRLFDADEETSFKAATIVQNVIRLLQPHVKVKAWSVINIPRYRAVLDPVEAGRELRATAVLSGEIRRHAKSWEIDVELVGVQDGDHLWGDTLHYSVGTAAAIVKNILEALAIEVPPAVLADLARRETQNIKALDMYMRGRAHWNNRSPQSLLKALTKFRDAINLDPSYAHAHAGIADAYGILCSFGYELLAPREAAPKAIAAAERAIELNPTLAEPWATLGAMKHDYEYDWTGGEHCYLRALALNDSYATAHQWYSVMLMQLGRFTESMEELRIAKTCDPQSRIIDANIGMSYWVMGDQERALAHYREMTETYPDFGVLYYLMAQSYAQVGNYEKAVESFSKAFVLNGESPVLLAFRAHANYRLGAEDVGRADENRLQELRESNATYVSAFHGAIARLGRDDKRGAIRLIREAYEERSSWICWLNVHPYLQALRGEEQFSALLKEVGFRISD